RPVPLGDGRIDLRGQVPPHPDQFCATTSRSVRRNLDGKPSPSLEVAMRKRIGKLTDVVPSSSPCAAVDRSTRSPTNSASVNPRFMPGSVVLKVSDSTEWTGTIALAFHIQPLEPKPPSRTWS